MVGVFPFDKAAIVTTYMLDGNLYCNNHVFEEVEI